MLSHQLAFTLLYLIPKTSPVSDSAVLQAWAGWQGERDRVAAQDQRGDLQGGVNAGSGSEIHSENRHDRTWVLGRRRALKISSWKHTGGECVCK